MSSHKIAIITQNSIKGPSALKSSAQRKQTRSPNKNRDPPYFTTVNVEDTVYSILEQTNGNLDHASKLLDKKLSETNQLIEELTEARSHLTKEQFDERLTALKHQHRNTVALCENLYSLTHRSENESATQQPKAVTFSNAADLDSSRSGEFIRESLAELERRVTLEEWEDAAARSAKRSFSSTKPPLPRAPTRSRDAATHAASARAGLGVSRYLSGSLDGQHWPARGSGDEYDDDEEEGEEDEERALKRHYQELLRSKVKAMWSDVDAGTRHRSGSLDRSWNRADRERANEVRQSEQPDRWRHRITVPEPFSMTLRDEIDAKKKSRSMQLFEEDQQKRQKSEEAECRVRFKANPVPAHVYMPLFDEIQEERESRRREVREHSRELLKSQERPFGFAKRDEEKKRRQKDRLTEADKYRQYQRSAEGDRKETVVKARPVPPSAGQARSRRLQEDELFRQIKVRMRAEEMMRRSAAPGEMMQRQRQMEERKQQRLAKYQRPGSSAGKQQQQQQQQRRQRPHSADGRRPRVGRDAPDFDRLHRAFQLELLERQADMQVTYPKPFSLRTQQRGQRIQHRTEHSLQQQRDPKAAANLHDFSRRYPTDQRSARTIGTHDESPPARLTNSAQLRESRRGAERDVAFQRQRQDEAQQLQRQLRRRQLAESLRTSTADAEAMLGPSIRDRTRSKVESQRELEEGYRQKMRELNEKMRERDLLVVQQAKLIAQQKAKAKYRQTLLDAGVDPKKVDEMARNYQESDLAAYTDAGRDADDDVSSVPNGSDYDPYRKEELDETRFGAPSPVHE